VTVCGSCFCLASRGCTFATSVAPASTGSSAPCFELDVRADIYVADLAGGVVDARRRCLTALAASALTRDIRRIVIERDDGMVDHDKRTLAAAIRAAAPANPFEYRWERAHDEPLLWIPDALAWCWAARGTWQADIRPIVTLHQV